MVDDKHKSNLPPLSLHVPEPKFRPGDAVDYSDLQIPEAGAQARPDINTAPKDMQDMVYDMVRVLDDDHKAVGPWDPKLDDEILLKMLRTMVQVRTFDDRLHRQQRQGKTSFYMKCTGEEATSVAAAIMAQSMLAANLITTSLSFGTLCRCRSLYLFIGYAGLHITLQGESSFE